MKIAHTDDADGADANAGGGKWVEIKLVRTFALLASVGVEALRGLPVMNPRRLRFSECTRYATINASNAIPR